MFSTKTHQGEEQAVQLIKEKSIRIDKNQSCIEACLRCASVCNFCASACTQEYEIQMMAHCIQLDMECAAVCYAAAQLMSLGSSRATEFCRLCAEICDACSAECEKHDNDHCQECAKVCRQCAEECRRMT